MHRRRNSVPRKLPTSHHATSQTVSLYSRAVLVKHQSSAVTATIINIIVIRDGPANSGPFICQGPRLSPSEPHEAFFRESPTQPHLAVRHPLCKSRDAMNLSAALPLAPSPSPSPSTVAPPTGAGPIAAASPSTRRAGTLSAVYRRLSSTTNPNTVHLLGHLKDRWSCR